MYEESEEILCIEETTLVWAEYFKDFPQCHDLSIENRRVGSESQTLIAFLYCSCVCVVVNRNGVFYRCKFCLNTLCVFIVY